MRTMRKIIEIDEKLCTGCGKCVPSCEEGAIEIVNGKARLAADRLCDGLGACLGECPEGALRVVEREAEEFDEAAVEIHLAGGGPEGPGFSGCAGSQTRSFAADAGALPEQEEGSALTHWPVQLRLMSPSAPYLDGAHLLVAADCVPVAYARFHQDLLSGKVALVGCPKFDDAGAAVVKFTEIFSTAKITEVTVVVMEVPCCQRLPQIVEAGMDQSGALIPLNRVVVSLRGKILERIRMR